jgi:hypothetical protein
VDTEIGESFKMNISNEKLDKIDLRFKVSECERLIQERRLEIEALTTLKLEFEEEIKKRFEENKDN